MIEAVVLNPGFYSSIQDLGRLDHRAAGVPQSGAMDLERAWKLNQALGNPNDAAVLEMVTIGVKLQFSGRTCVAIDNNCTARINGQEVDLRKVVTIQSGDVLHIGKSIEGPLMYLAITGGWQTQAVLGSRSMYAGITSTALLKKGDVLPYNVISDQDCKSALLYSIPRKEERVPTLEALKGPEFELLSKEWKLDLETKEWAVPERWNRMAYEVNGNLKAPVKQIPTAPVVPGTVQLSPSGKLFFLMRDAQTTGGYPRVLQLQSTSIDKLSRLKVNSLFKIKINDV